MLLYGNICNFNLLVLVLLFYIFIFTVDVERERERDHTSDMVHSINIHTASHVLGFDTTPLLFKKPPLSIKLLVNAKHHSTKVEFDVNVS